MSTKGHLVVTPPGTAPDADLAPARQLGLDRGTPELDRAAHQRARQILRDYQPTPYAAHLWMIMYVSVNDKPQADDGARASR